jgi:PAS domain S-box-containing protein
MFASEENKLKLILLAILIASITIVLVYHRTVINAGKEGESEQLLYNFGKNYEFEIRSEFTRFASLSDLLARTLAQNKNQTISKEIKGIFKDLIYRNSRLNSIELVFKEAELETDSTILLPTFIDSLQKSSVRVYKTKNGILEDEVINEFNSDKMRIAVKKANLVDQTIILAPENILSDGKTISVVPVLSNIYNGKQFLGYIILYISVDWMAQGNYKYSELLEFTEVFVSSPDETIIALNSKKDLISEPISKVCLSCKGLLGPKGQEYNPGIENNYLTICLPWKPIPEGEHWNICVRAKLSDISGYLHYNSSYSIIIALFVMVLAAILIILVLKRYIKIWEGLDKFANAILSGEKGVFEKEDEMVVKGKSIALKDSLVNIAKSLDGLSNINNSALEGNYDVELENEFKNHQVYKSTKQFHKKYKSSLQELTNENKDLKHFKLLTEGLEKINKILKHYHNDLQQLSINVIHALVDILEIEMGAVFFLKKENEEQYLDLIVSYAYSENRFQKRRFNLGESLVGACAAEKRTIYMKKIPDDYLKIISGLGMSSPKSILIVPLIFENTVLGVIELGTLKDFDENGITFSERAAEIIANTLSMAETNIVTSELLEQTRKQTLELEKRDKLMLEAIDELKQLQNKTASSEAAVRAKLEAMNNTLMMVEYTSRGILLDANYKYLNTMNFALEEIKGIDVLELLKEADRAELIKIINTVKNGNFYEGLVRRHTRQGEEKWLIATYTPVYNDSNIVESILFYAIDITRMKKNDTQLKHKVKELTSQVEELRNLLKDKL